MNNKVKYSIWGFTIFLVGFVIYKIAKKDKPNIKGVNQLQSVDSTMQQPIKPTKPNVGNSSSINTNTTSNVDNIFIKPISNGVTYASQHEINTNNFTQQGLQQNWQNLNNLISSHQNWSNNVYGQENMDWVSQQANNSWAAMTTQYNAETNLLNDAVNSFLNGNPLGLQHNYYIKPDGKIGLYIYSSQGSSNCPDGYELYGNFCELLS